MCFSAIQIIWPLENSNLCKMIEFQTKINNSQFTHNYFIHDNLSLNIGLKFQINGQKLGLFTQQFCLLTHKVTFISKMTQLQLE